MRKTLIPCLTFAVIFALIVPAAAAGFRPVPGDRPDDLRLAAECGALRLTALQGGISFALGLTPSPAPRREVTADPRADLLGDRQPRSVEGQVVLLEFVGGDPNVRPEPGSAHPPLLNSYHGRDRARWLEGRMACADIVYRDIWPGVDLVLRPVGSRLAYEWRGTAEARQPIALRWRDATVNHQADGSEVVSTPHGSLIVNPPLGTAPTGWISLSGEAPTNMTASATTQSSATKDLDQVAWSTFIGGSSVEESFAVTSNGAGLTFFTGYTQSLDYPTIPGTVTVDEGSNVVVTALDENSGFPAWSTVIEGSGFDEGRAIDVLPNGNVVAVGRTGSVDFPTTPGATDSTATVDGSSYIAELDAQTGCIIWCTLLDDCMPFSVAATSDGGAVIAGMTLSMFPPMPTTIYAFQPSYQGGGSDAFVARVSSQGRQLDWCTYLGGSDYDQAYAVEVDEWDRPTVGGSTGGTYFSSDFPVTQGSYDSFFDGYASGFVTKLSADGQQLAWSTFVGGGPSNIEGSGSVTIGALKIGGDGRVVVAGRTSSSNMPVTEGAYQSSLRGHIDGFVSTLSADGSTLLQSTYLGCSSFTEMDGLSLPPGGGILVSGRAYGPTFPGPLGPDQFTIVGVNAAILVHLNGAGQVLLGSGVYGGSDYLQNIRHAQTQTGAAILMGSTWSADFPVTAGCYDDSIGGEDIFAMKVQSLVTPVSLRLFEAMREAAGARLRWLWEGFTAADGLRLWREEPGVQRRLVTEWDAGGVSGGEFTDGGAPVGEASYWLQLLADNGEESWYGPARLAAAALPERLAITSSAPNPFNPRTTIRYSLPQASRVTLAVYDQRGRLVNTLLDAAAPAGEQTADWDGRNDRGRAMASGAYVIRLATEQGTRTIKIALTR